MIDDENSRKQENPRIFLDISNDVCPLTLVRSKLLVERMASGQQATIHVGNHESARSIVATLDRSGRVVIQGVQEEATQGNLAVVIDIRKK